MVRVARVRVKGGDLGIRQSGAHNGVVVDECAEPSSVLVGDRSGVETLGLPGWLWV